MCMYKKVKLINHDCLPILMLLYIMLYIVLAYLMLYIVLAYLMLFAALSAKPSRLRKQPPRTCLSC